MSIGGSHWLGQGEGLPESTKGQSNGLPAFPTIWDNLLQGPSAFCISPVTRAEAKIFCLQVLRPCRRRPDKGGL